jgi:hypothetical protein
MNNPNDRMKRGSCQSCDKRRADRLEREVAMASLPFTTTPVFLTGQTKYNLQPAEGKRVKIADCRLPIANCRLEERQIRQCAIEPSFNRQSAIYPRPPRLLVPSRVRKNRPVVAMRRGDAERENVG